VGQVGGGASCQHLPAGSRVKVPRSVLEKLADVKTGPKKKKKKKPRERQKPRTVSQQSRKKYRRAAVQKLLFKHPDVVGTGELSPHRGTGRGWKRRTASPGGVSDFKKKSPTKEESSSDNRKNTGETGATTKWTNRKEFK